MHNVNNHLNDKITYLHNNILPIDNYNNHLNDSNHKVNSNLCLP